MGIAFVQALPVLALTLTALSLGPSFAHALEAPPRLRRWPPQLWIDATVRHGQFVLFRAVGGPLDVAAILASGLLALLMRGQAAFGWILAGATLLALALVAWFALVAPANRELATWRARSVPVAFASVRNRWETGHMVVAALKLLAFVALAAGITIAAWAA